MKISKLIKKSPKRSALFEKLKQELASETISVRALCRHNGQYELLHCKVS